MPHSAVLVRLESSGIATLTLNNPGRLNALTREMGTALETAVVALRENDRLRAVLLTGAGRAFSAGGDLDFIEQNTKRPAAENKKTMAEFYRLFLSLRQIPVPTIAVINGPAIGAGLCLALACDIRYVATDAQVGMNFVRLNLHPGMGGEYFLRSAVGPGRAAELLYSGRLISGDEAARIGLCNAAYSAGRLLPEAQSLADEIATSGPLAVRQTRKTLREAEDRELARFLEREAEAQAEDYATADLKEGVAAIREKRAPRFSGR
jgi:enoyl-CoA hydratase/carnithine racemase